MYVQYVVPGTCKLGSYCTAAVEALYLASGAVEVTYHKTHFGHELNLSDLIHVRLKKQDRQSLAGQLFLHTHHVM